MRYRIFGQTGLRVSSVALGAGNFGKGWGGFPHDVVAGSAGNLAGGKAELTEPPTRPVR